MRRADVSSLRQDVLRQRRPGDPLMTMGRRVGEFSGHRGPGRVIERRPGVSGPDLRGQAPPRPRTGVTQLSICPATDAVSPGEECFVPAEVVGREQAKVSASTWPRRAWTASAAIAAASCGCP